jgi:hypothetical protein
MTQWYQQLRLLNEMSGTLVNTGVWLIAVYAISTKATKCLALLPLLLNRKKNPEDQDCWRLSA